MLLVCYTKATQKGAATIANALPNCLETAKRCPTADAARHAIAARKTVANAACQQRFLRTENATTQLVKLSRYYIQVY